MICFRHCGRYLLRSNENFVVRRVEVQSRKYRVLSFPYKFLYFLKEGVKLIISRSISKYAC